MINGDASQSYMASAPPTSTTQVFSELKEVKAFPNPVVDNLTVELTSTVNASTEFTFQTISGKTIQTYQRAVNIGENNFQFDVSQLNSGIYFIEIQNGKETQTIKFVK